MDEHMLRMMRLSGKGYVCSQIVVKMALELRGEENPSLVRAMAGPEYGCGTGKGTCGALVGGCCLLALYAGKGADDETESDRFPLMLSQLSDWFSERIGGQFGGTICEVIVGDAGPAASMQTCGTIVAETYARAMEILAENDIDPTEA